MARVEYTLNHELILAFDDCRVELNQKNPKHIACSEVSKSMQFFTVSRISLEKHAQAGGFVWGLCRLGTVGRLPGGGSFPFLAFFILSSFSFAFIHD